MIFLLQLLLSALQVIVLIGLLYYYLLLIAGSARPAAIAQNSAKDQSPLYKFAILIPAHDEAAVIGQTVRQLTRQTYPRHLFDIYVAADHCRDQTAGVAREAGAIGLERDEGPRGRKAYPLQWLLQQVLNSDQNYQAVVIFDADSQVDPAFLGAMAAGLGKGYPALQGQHVISNPQDTVFSRLAAIDMRLNNFLRNQAKHNLQLSSRLMGDAMCLEAGLLRQLGWGGESLIEDREFEIHLLLAGERVRYVPAAISYGQASSRWGDASKQRLRWYSGVMQLQRAYLRPLLGKFARTGNTAVLDRALELLLPAYSWLSILTVMLFGIQLLSPDLALLLPWPVMLLAVLGWLLFPILALWGSKAPAWCYRTLLYAPIYLFWRLGQSIQVALKRGRVKWVRTRRREEKI
jgi:cellulose synthase/poly-beta-1,6-N-acetylglucosamine synthase-like glycosyltransferase